MSGIQIIEVAQGSPEWHQARAGAITASMFSVCRERTGELTDQQSQFVRAVQAGTPEKEAAKAAGYKAVPRSEKIEAALRGEQVGDFSDKAKNYAFRLAVERISGEPLDEGFETYAMRRGHELEPEARLAHERRIAMLIEHAGIVLTEDGLFGASADGLINDDGGSEYKCLISPERLRSVIVDQDLSEFMDQVQGCMWLTGRQWWHFVLYCPALRAAGRDLIIHEQRRDDDYIEALEKDLIAFNGLVELYRHQIENANGGITAAA